MRSRVFSSPWPLSPVPFFSRVRRPARVLPTVGQAKCAAFPCRPIFGLLIVLAVLAAVPLPVAPHNFDTENHPSICGQGQFYDLCHSPYFDLGQLTIMLNVPPDLRGVDTFSSADLKAKDQDHADLLSQDNARRPTMVYELRAATAPLPSDNDDVTPGQGHAAYFRVSKDSDGTPRISTKQGMTYSENEYRVFLVACDGNFRRGYMTLIIKITRNPNNDNNNNRENNNQNDNNDNVENTENTENNQNTDNNENNNQNNNQNNQNNNDENRDNNNDIGGSDNFGNNNNGNNNGNNSGGNNGGNNDGNTENTRRGPTGPNSPPAYPSLTATRSFPESALPGWHIGPPVTATDEDGDPLTYTLEGPDAASFEIDASTGQLLTRPGVVYDYETKSSYLVTVRATDPGGASATILVTIHVLDVPERPEFPDSSITRSFPESALPGWHIGPPVTATDEDGDPLTYTLEGPDAASFEIDASTGQLLTRPGVVYDYETKSSYLVTVRATDPGGASATILVTIHVLDVPERPEFLDSSITRSFPENAPVGWHIGAPVMATDEDGDPLTYTLEGPEAASFEIDASTGQLQTRPGVVYDYETKSSYLVTVRATDPGGASVTILVTILVLDVPERPEFPDSSITRSFPEDAPVGWHIGPPVTASDSDGDALIYSLEGADAASFDIETSTGQLLTRRGVVYDYETRLSYAVVVRAVDPSHSSAAVAVEVNVLDVPEAPGFPASDTSRSFPENSPPGRHVGAPMAATDDDGDLLAYTLGGPDAASFVIDARSGQIRTTSGVIYDYEARTFYSVTVTATDPTQLSGTVVVGIHVTNVNEKPATPAAPSVRAVSGSSTSLRVRWAAPGLNGGPELTGYEVEYRPGVRSRWRAWPHAGTGTTTVITDLGTSTHYEVRVRALNGETPSDWSLPGRGRTNATVNGWLARFARTVAQEMLQGVEDRMTAPRRPGLRAAIAGRGLHHDAAVARYGTDRRVRVAPGGGWAPTPRLEGAFAHHASGPLLLTEPELLMGSGFELAGDAGRGGVVGAWGRAGYSRFDGMEQSYLLDGDITTGTLGVDYVKGPWLAGLALSHSWGVGTHERAYSLDAIEAMLTGLYPYAGATVTDRLSVWGVGGFGRGVLTLTPERGAAMETDVDLAMVAVAVRGTLLHARNGFDLALQTDGFWVQATSEAVAGLLSADPVVTRARLALESTYTAALGGASRSSLIPKLELGVRHDGGDAETGWGVDVGGGLLWSAPARGVSLELEARSLVGHQTEGFRDWSASARMRYDPNPASGRGLSASLESSFGSAPPNGQGTLIDHASLAGVMSDGGAGAPQLTAQAAYGFPVLGGRFTGTPWVGAGVLENGRDYRVGYRISAARRSGADLVVGVEGGRRENMAADAEHTVALRVGMHW